VVNATDQDRTRPNNLITYRIETGARDKFVIDPVTGVVSVAPSADLDRDKFGGSYDIVVTAVDGGCPQLTGNATININISRVNNRAPSFPAAGPQYIVGVREDVALGAALVVCSAVDVDSDSVLQYRILEGSIEGRDMQGNQIHEAEYISVSYLRIKFTNINRLDAIQIDIIIEYK